MPPYPAIILRFFWSRTCAGAQKVMFGAYVLRILIIFVEKGGSIRVWMDGGSCFPRARFHSIFAIVLLFFRPGSFKIFSNASNCYRNLVCFVEFAMKSEILVAILGENIRSEAELTCSWGGGTRRNGYTGDFCCFEKEET